ncbi:hypothetical protein GCM10008955_31590 [Deinococcus malanensis]|uniref:Uncharacterized protein n=1 Tax=Deinococcus malanensis TaxID=1706855 RepID=A0ABQ2F2K0_9DEIO|nr:hypothetical protein GCM10008955_31590 [Deinococcus malanensis]
MSVVVAWGCRDKGSHQCPGFPPSSQSAGKSERVNFTSIQTQGQVYLQDRPDHMLIRVELVARGFIPSRLQPVVL